MTTHQLKCTGRQTLPVAENCMSFGLLLPLVFCVFVVSPGPTDGHHVVSFTDVTSARICD